MSRRVLLFALGGFAANCLAGSLPDPGAGLCPIETAVTPRGEDAAAACLLGDLSPERGSDRLIVDARPRAERNGAWIPGAVQLDLDEIPIHALVKSAETVVLVGNGKDTAALLRRCIAWHEGGLRQMRVLEGGLPAWRRSGGAVSGSTGSVDAPLVASVPELYRLLRDARTTLMVAAADRLSVPLAATKARVTSVAPAASPRGVLARYAGRREPRGGTLVVALRAEAEAARWRAAARSLGLADPLFFFDGFSNYGRYEREQASIRESANRPLPTACERG